MNSHPPLTNAAEITRQRFPALVSMPPPPQGESLLVMVCPRAQSVGRRYALAASSTLINIGRDAGADIVVASDAVSRRHCKLVRDGLGWWVEDLLSTNGTFVNDEPVARRLLRPGDQLRVGDTVLKYLAGGDIESSLLDRMLRDVVRDGLTQAYTRGYFREHLESMLHEVRLGQGRASLLVVDLDHFKQVNDSRGHVAGDNVLREAAARMTSELPDDAVFGRLGGEEFAALLPAIGAAGARMVAEALRRSVCAAPIRCGESPLTVTVSVGLAEASPTMHDIDAWLRAADERLYEAKRSGRNRVAG